MMSGVSQTDQELVLRPVLFNIFLNDLNDRAEWTLRKFADDTKLTYVAEGHAAIQRDLGRRSPATEEEEAQALVTHWEPPIWKATWQENALDIPTDAKLNMSQQCGPVTKKTKMTFQVNIKQLQTWRTNLLER